MPLVFVVIILSKQVSFVMTVEILVKQAIADLCVIIIHSLPITAPVSAMIDQSALVGVVLRPVAGMGLSAKPVITVRLHPAMVRNVMKVLVTMGQQVDAIPGALVPAVMAVR